MIESLKRINDMNIKLSNFTQDDLDKLYARVFSSADGELVFQDMSNRFFMNHPTESSFDEGQRSVLLSIQSRLVGSIQKKKDDSENG